MFVWQSNRNYVLSEKGIRYFSLESILGYWHTIINSDRFKLSFHASNNQTTAFLLFVSPQSGTGESNCSLLDTLGSLEFASESEVRFWILIPMRIVGSRYLVCGLNVYRQLSKQQTIGNDILVQKSFVPSPNRIVITQFSMCI